MTETPKRRRKQEMHLRLDDDVREGIKRFADEREWTVTHAINSLLRRALEQAPPAT